MGSQRTRGTHSKAHRQSTCLADAMAGRRTPSVCRSPPREAAPGSSAAPRAGALPRGLPLSLSPSSAGGPQRGTPGPAAAAAEDGADDRSPPPPGCAALRCAGLGRLPARSRSPPPWPRAPPCGLRRDCSGTGRAPGRRLSLSQTPVFERSFHFTFTGKRVLRGRDAAYDCSAKQRELFQMFSAIPPLFQKHVLPVVTVLLQGNR